MELIAVFRIGWRRLRILIIKGYSGLLLERKGYYCIVKMRMKGK